MASDTETLKALEARRCAAISKSDVDTLKAMLVDDYVHVHMTGHVDDRAGHLKAVSSRPRRTERGELLVRVYGDLAVITGELTNHMTNAAGETNATKAYCHQVAARQDGAWRFVSIQLTPLTARSERCPCPPKMTSSPSKRAAATRSARAISKRSPMCWLMTICTSSRRVKS